MDLLREAGTKRREDSKSAPGGERRRAQTAATSGDNKHHSKQMRLIGTLRKLIIASAEISTSITSSDKSLGPAENLSTYKHRPNVGSLSVMQSAPKAKTPTQKFHQSSDSNRMYNGDCLSSKGTAEELGTLIISRGNTMLRTPDRTSESNSLRIGHSLKVRDTKSKEDKTTPAKLKTYSQHLQILKGRRMNILRSSTSQSQMYPVSAKPGEVDGMARTSPRVDPTLSKRNFTCLSISNSTNYQNVLEHTRHRLSKKVSSAPQKLTQTSRHPPIVIPCHTNVECTYCGLYDEPLESSDTETESELVSETREDNSIFESKQAEMPTIVHNSMPLRERSTKLPKVLRFEDKEKPVCEKTTPTLAELTTNDFIEKYRKERITKKSLHQKRDVESEPDGILPKIYRLRYTKSSHFTAGPNYSMSEATSAN